MEQFLHICGSPTNPEAGVILLECESFRVRAEVALSLAPTIREPQLPLSLTFAPNIQTILPATAKTRRKGYKIMSRRCQMGTEVVEGQAEELDADGHLLLRDGDGCDEYFGRGGSVRDRASDD